MKFVGNGWWPNFACYAKLAVLTYLVMNDPSVIHQIYTGQGQEVAKNLGQAVKDQFDSAMAKTRSKSSGNAGPHGLDSCRFGRRIAIRRDGFGKLGHRAAAVPRLAGRFNSNVVRPGLVAPQPAASPGRRPTGRYPAANRPQRPFPASKRRADGSGNRPPYGVRWLATAFQTAGQLTQPAHLKSGGNPPHS